MTSHPFAHRPWTGLASMLAGAALIGCVTPHDAPATIDPVVTLAAHESHGEVVIDRMQGGKPAVVAPETTWHFGTEPVFVLREDGVADATLSVASPARVLVRHERRADAPVAGRVEPSWEDGAVRLTLEPEEGPPLHTDVFARSGGGAGPSTLSRMADLSIDVPGTYEAAVRNTGGGRVGWIRVHIGSRNGPARYEAVLPPSVDEALAAATVQALDSEIGFIERTANGVTFAPENR